MNDLNFPKKRCRFLGGPLWIALLILAFFPSAPAHAQIGPSDFVSVWQTSQVQGYTGAIYIAGSGNFTVYYESIPAGVSGSFPGTFENRAVLNMPAEGTYRIAIRPVGPTPFHRIQSMHIYQDLLAIEQWGTAVWSSFQASFSQYTKLSTVSAADAPVLTNVTSMERMFEGCTALMSVPNINNWDVSEITDMSRMFESAQLFNEPLDNWDASNVTDMSSLFFRAAAFNQPLNSWDVGAVTNFSAMFYEASAFNQALSSWNVTNATDMSYMFVSAAAFNQPLDSWNVSNTSNLSFMFALAGAFNQNLGKWTLNTTANMENMLIATGMDCAHYSSTLIGWSANTSTPAGRSLIATGLAYGTDASGARDNLVTSKQWTISGDTFDATCVSLPVTLISFDAFRQESQAQLSWATTEETNSDHFEIQRSENSQTWHRIGVLTSSGESTVRKTYHFEDPAPLGGLNYYRLKMVDKDGTFAYSRIQGVDFSGTSRFSIYPNPATERLFIDNHDKVKSVTVYNSAGIKLLENKNVTAQGIDVSRLSPSQLLLKVTLHDGSIETGKAIIEK